MGVGRGDMLLSMEEKTSFLPVLGALKKSPAAASMVWSKVEAVTMPLYSPLCIPGYDIIWEAFLGHIYSYSKYWIK